MELKPWEIWDAEGERDKARGEMSDVTQVYGIRCKTKNEKIQDWDYDSLTNITFLYKQRCALFKDIQEDAMAVPEFFFEIKQDMLMLRDLVLGKFNILLVIEEEN